MLKSNYVRQRHQSLKSHKNVNGPLNTEVVVQRCSVEKVFLEILQNSQENTRARVGFLIELRASGLYIYSYLNYANIA